MDFLKDAGTKKFLHELAMCFIATLALVSLTGVCYVLHLNLATAGFLYVVVVVLLSRTGNLTSSIVAAVIAALCLAHLAPPTYSF